MYQVLARKYRPQEFSSLKGQDILRNNIAQSIINKRVPHSFLLSGIRGIGKTSIARIIAKSLSCTDIRITEDNLVHTCQKCRNCQSFAQGNHPDIIEIDAASKTGIDEIKAVLSAGEFKPLLGKYKIFIIDEVHMLSRSSFNALLKTLEEPPPHMLFILATTELHKIPVTVISRCQKYDLNPISQDHICNIISDIARAEGINISSAALELIAKQSEGSARDAITLLDQLMNMMQQGEEISKDMIMKFTGISSIQNIVDICSAIFEENPKLTLEILHNLGNNGAEPKNLITDIMHFLSFLCKKKMIESHNETIYEPFKDAVDKILSHWEFQSISSAWQIFSKDQQFLNNNSNWLLYFEMMALKAIHAINITKDCKVLMQKDRPRQLSSK